MIERDEVPSYNPMDSNRPLIMGGDRPQAGVNLDHIDIQAGLRELHACGYDDPSTRMVIDYALARHKRGEEAAAEKGAIDRSFHGISFTCWRRVLAAAMAGGMAKAEQTTRGDTNARNPD